MEIEVDYPLIKRKINHFLLARKIILAFFLIATITVIVVNLAVGGKLWMFYVIGGEIIFYYAFLNRPLVDKAFIKRLTIVLFLICAYLYLIDILNNTKWSYLVVSIIAFSIVLIQLFMFFVGPIYQKKKLIVLFLTSLGAIIYFILSLLNVVKINWAIIVLGSISFLSLLILLVFYRKLMFNEIKKYFSIK